jgi:hypothetical protein
VPASGWLAVRRRMRETGMDELELGLGDLRELMSRPESRRAVLDLVRRDRARDGDDGARGLAALDVTRLRLTFPSLVRVRLRSGRMLETDGREPGSCGTPIEAQRGVVADKWAATGGRPADLAELLGP